MQIGRTRGAAHSTAKSFDAREIHIWRFGDGLVVSFEVLVDTPEMVAALS